MAWTAPRTWVEGEDVVAAMLNTHVRDNFKAITDPWTTYTPVVSTHGWNTTGSTIEGRYIRIGKTVHFRVEWLLGSCAQGTDNPSVSLPPGLPIRTSSITNAMYAFNATYHQVGAFMTLTFAEAAAGATTMQLMYQDPGTTYATRSAVTGTQPYDWTSTAVFSIHGTYETDAA